MSCAGACGRSTTASITTISLGPPPSGPLSRRHSTSWTNGRLSPPATSASPRARGSVRPPGGTISPSMGRKSSLIASARPRRADGRQSGGPDNLLFLDGGLEPVDLDDQRLRLGDLRMLHRHDELTVLLLGDLAVVVGRLAVGRLDDFVLFGALLGNGFAGGDEDAA